MKYWFIKKSKLNKLNGKLVYGKVFKLTSPTHPVFRRKKKHLERKIARERIEILFELAMDEIKKRNVSRARRYVEHMLNLSKKYNVRIPKEMKYHICKGCHAFLYPGITSQVRLKKKKVVIKCLYCGKYKRYPYKK